MKLAAGAVIFYLVGIMVFLTYADFSVPVWSQIYHVWDKLKDTLLIAGIYTLLPKYRKSLRWAVWYSVIRVSWELLAWVLAMDINNRKAVNNLFLILATAFFVLLLKDFKQWQRQKD